MSKKNERIVEERIVERSTCFENRDKKKMICELKVSFENLYKHLFRITLPAKTFKLKLVIFAQKTLSMWESHVTCVKKIRMY